jgi:glycosyltransferase 2 family protein
VTLAERIERTARDIVDRLTTGRVRVAAQLLLLAGFVFILLRLRSLWLDNTVHLSRVAWWWLIPAVAAGLCSILLSGVIWRWLLRRLGGDPPAATVAIFLQAQLGKYVPGSVWQYAGRAALGRGYSLPMKLVAKSFPIELAATVLAAAPFSILLVGWVATAGVLGIVVIVASTSLFLPRRGVSRVALGASLLYATTWPFVGASFWMTGRALVHAPPRDLAVYTGAFAVAWLAGLAAVYAPGGLGVREAVLVALLRGKLGSADALLVALASRAVFTLSDLLGSAIGFAALARLRGRSPKPAAEP